MKNKQEQIEEMAKDNCTVVGVSCKECEHKKFCATIHYSEKFYNKGYRKASDVIDEFVKRLEKYIESRNDLWDEDRPEFDEEFVKFGIQIVADEMRQEVEK